MMEESGAAAVAEAGAGDLGRAAAAGDLAPDPGAPAGAPALGSGAPAALSPPLGTATAAAAQRLPGKCDTILILISRRTASLL